MDAREKWIEAAEKLAEQMVLLDSCSAMSVGNGDNKYEEEFIDKRAQLFAHLRTTPEGFALVPVGMAALHTNMKTTTSTQPDWHDAPTCAGDWLCDEGRHNVTDWRAIRVTPRLATANARDLWVNGSLYYGPIPQYKKAPDATP